MNSITKKSLFLVLVLPAILWSGVLKAEVPRVVADIAPVYSLVSMVMDGVGEPQLLIRQNMSPHHYSMRPSEAKALQEADLVVYVGRDMTPWLEPLFRTVATSPHVLDLSEVDGVLVLPYREGPVFEDHEGHDHEEEGHDDHEGHDHEGNDPHMWLDPVNALVWLDAIASELRHIDPENAERYSANAKSAKDEIMHEIHHIEDHLKTVQGKSYLVFHDAYQYFENRFGITATGSISLSDASKPSSRRLRELKHLFEEQAISCVLSEPQFSSKLIDSVFGGYKPHIGVVDPIGIGLKLGPTLYTTLLEGVTLGIADCVNH